jgi:hypothetical protein
VTSSPSPHPPFLLPTLRGKALHDGHGHVTYGHHVVSAIGRSPRHAINLCGYSTKCAYEYSECARRIFQRALIWQENYIPCSTTSAFSKCIYTAPYGILLLLAYVCVRLQMSRINTCRTRSHPALRAGAIALFGSVTCSSFSLGCPPTARGEYPPSAAEQQTPVCAERWRGMHITLSNTTRAHGTCCMHSRQSGGCTHELCSCCGGVWVVDEHEPKSGRMKTEIYTPAVDVWAAHFSVE